MAVFQQAVRSPRMARLRYDFGIVAAARQHKCQVGIEQMGKLEDRTPGRHVIGLGADREDGNADVLDMDGLSPTSNRPCARSFPR